MCNWVKSFEGLKVNWNNVSKYIYSNSLSGIYVPSSNLLLVSQNTLFNCIYDKYQSKKWIWTWTSVQGMQYVLDMAIKAKISEDLVNKQNKWIWLLILWPLPEDFEKLAFAEDYFLKFTVFELVTLIGRMCCCFFLDSFIPSWE